jgi:hypothetical protein
VQDGSHTIVTDVSCKRWRHGSVDMPIGGVVGLHDKDVQKAV